MKKLRIILCLMLVLMLIFTGCASSQPSAEESTGTVETADGRKIKDTVIVAVNRDPQSLDPAGSLIGVDSRIRYCLYDTLLAFNEDMTVKPWLAESYEYVNDTTIRFKLREGVKFHNGDTMTAEDVMFSLERAQQSSYSGGNLDVINFEKSSIIDENTIELVCDSVFAPLLSSIADPYYAGITQKAWVEEHGPDISECPMGTGPFMFKDRYAGDRIELVRFDDYWGEKAQFTNLIWRIIVENSTRAIEAETGGVDIAQTLGASDVLRIEEEDSVNLEYIYMPSVGSIYLNCAKAPFDNKLVRQAIAYGMDMEAVNEAVWRGVQPVGKSVIAETVVGFYDGLTPYTRDIEKSKELLAEAGYANGFDCTLDVSDDTSLVTMAEMMKNQLAEVGINVTINVLDATTTNARRESGDYDMSYGTWGSSNGDPDSAIYPCMHSSRYESAGTWFKNDEVDKYLDLERTTIDEAKRVEYLQKVQELLHDELPWIYVTQLVFVDAVGKNVEGYDPLPTTWVRYNELVVYED